MILQDLVLPSFAITALAGGSLAHEPAVQATPTLAPHAVDTTRVHLDELGDGTIWARTAPYKARFDEGGASYIPFLGAHAPRNYPVLFAPPECTLGGDELATARAAPPRLLHDTVRYERGVVDELYVLTPESVEQRFVVDEPIVGELRVRIAVGTDLRPAVDRDELVFENELGGVSYGRATAVDAAGRMTPLVRTWRNGAIEIVVPAGLCASAAYPLVIDPLIATFAIAATAQDDKNPDVAFDGESQRFLVCWEVAFSAADHDVFAELRTTTGALVAGSGLFIESGSDFWANPACGAEYVTGRFAVVAEVGDPALAARQIWARTRIGNTQATAFFVAGPQPGDCHNPDVEGIAGGSASIFCVVWQRDVNSDGGNIEARRIGPSATTSSELLIDAATTQENRRPRIAVTSNSSFWTIVYERHLSLTNRNVIAAILGFSALLPTAILEVANGPEDDRLPDVSSSPRTNFLVLVAWQQSSGGQRDILVRQLQISGQLLTVAKNLSSLDPATQSLDQVDVAVQSDCDAFFVSWSEPTTAGGFDVFGAEVHLVDQVETTSGIRVLLGTAVGDERRSRLATRNDQSDANAGYMAVWNHATASNASDVRGAIYTGTRGLPVRIVCPGDGSGTACPCGNNGAANSGCANSVVSSGARLGAFGIAATLADSLLLVGVDMPPNSSCLYFQGTALSSGGSGTVFGDGLRCATGTVVRLAIALNNSTGQSLYPGAGDPHVSVKGLVPTNGGTRSYQVWYRNAASFCTGSTFNLTNALEVDWCRL